MALTCNERTRRTADNKGRGQVVLLRSFTEKESRYLYRKRAKKSRMMSNDSSRYPSKQTQESWPSLPPWLGKTGSIVFFLTLFSLAHKDAGGYAEFRKCHGNCVNGILHAIGMPLAVSGVFMIVRSATDSPVFTRHIQFVVTTAYLALYLQYEQSRVSPWLFYVVYACLFEFGLYRHVYSQPSWKRRHFLWWGAALVLFNVSALEAVGHGFFEHHHSYVSEFFNSVFHTPLYGVNSVLLSTGLMPPRSDHTCW